MTLEDNRRWISKERLLDAALFFAALLSVASQVRSAHFASASESLAAARAIAERGAYAGPLALLSGHTALQAPVYPLLLSMLMSLFGTAAAFTTALTICHMLAHALHAAMLPRLSELLLRDRLPGIFAASLAILLPVTVFAPQSEAILCPLGLMLFCLTTDRRLPRGGSGGALFTGLFAGVLAMLNPACLIVCAGWLAHLLRRNRVAFPRRAAVLVTAAFLVSLMPWMLRTSRTFYRLFPDSDSAGSQLSVAAGDRAPSETLGALPRAHRPHSARVSPSLVRAVLFWFPDAEGLTTAHGYAMALLSAGALAGLGLMIRRRIPLAGFTGAVFAIFTVLNSCLTSDPGNRLPVFWLSLLLSGYLINEGVEAYFPRPEPLQSSVPQLHLLD